MNVALFRTVFLLSFTLLSHILVVVFENILGTQFRFDKKHQKLSNNTWFVHAAAAMQVSIIFPFWKCQKRKMEISKENSVCLTLLKEEESLRTAAPWSRQRRPADSSSCLTYVLSCSWHLCFVMFSLPFPRFLVFISCACFCFNTQFSWFSKLPYLCFVM